MDECTLDSECVGILRAIAKKRLGGNCTFADDDARLLGVLAQRAVMAGLHRDVKNPKTRQNMEKAAEIARDEVEKVLGFPIAAAPETAAERDRLRGLFMLLQEKQRNDELTAWMVRQTIETALATGKPKEPADHE